MSESHNEKLKRLFDQNGLLPEDTFKMKRRGKDGKDKIIPIILRSGIEKIQMKQKIHVTFESPHISDTLVVIKAIAVNEEGLVIQSYGESSKQNTIQKYPVAMAEKRALSRAILKITGLYKEGVFGEDEFEESRKINDDLIGQIKEIDSLEDLEMFIETYPELIDNQIYKDKVNELQGTD